MDKAKKTSIIDRFGEIKQVTAESSSKKKANDFSYVTYLNLGFYLVTPLLLGVFLGTVIDNWLHTKPVFIILLITLGTIASFYNLIKMTRDVTH